MSYRETLIEAANSLGIDVPEALADAMALHHQSVLRWAKKINLTTVVDPDEAAIVHGLDCLLLAGRLEADAQSELVDVGSGAGFPGVVIALARPELRVRLLEPIRKRASFLRVVLAELRRDDVEVVEGRMEPQSGTAPWTTDLLVSRATIPPLDLIRRAPPYLRPGGRLYLMEAAGAPAWPEVEAVGVRAGLVAVERHEAELPGGRRRFIDELRRDP